MYIIEIKKKAFKNLIKLAIHLQKKIEEGIDNLEKLGLDSANIKQLSNTKTPIYRKRIGKARIIFTIQQIAGKITIWVIAIEKDTKKDYSKWIEHVVNNMKS